MYACDLSKSTASCYPGKFYNYLGRRGRGGKQNKPYYMDDLYHFEETQYKSAQAKKFLKWQPYVRVDCKHTS